MAELCTTSFPHVGDENATVFVKGTEGRAGVGSYDTLFRVWMPAWGCMMRPAKVIGLGSNARASCKANQLDSERHGAEHGCDRTDISSKHGYFATAIRQALQTAAILSRQSILNSG
eukprot:5649517-Pleurochrysis_carterae.AAC.1